MKINLHDVRDAAGNRWRGARGPVAAAARAGGSKEKAAAANGLTMDTVLGGQGFSRCCARGRARSGGNRRDGRAFTLIEMILAVGITAIVLLSVSAILFTALHLRGATQDLVDAELPLDQTGTLLKRDLQCAMSPTTNGIFTGDFKVGNVSSPGIGQPVAIEMYTATGALSDKQPWGDVQKVTYELRNPVNPTQPGKDLVRSVTRNILATATVDVEDQWLMGGVADLRISCFDGNQWQQTWDTTNPTSSDTNLPQAVRVEIQLSGMNNGNNQMLPVQFLVPIDSESRTNT